MELSKTSIIRHNMPVFYIVDALRALFFSTTIWVAFELQFLTLSQLTLIESLIVGVTLLMQLPTGAFADLFGKKKAMIIGCLLFASALTVWSFSHSFSMFLVYAVMMGAASAFIDGTREALLYDTLKQEGKDHEFPVISSKLSMIFQVALASATVVSGIIGNWSYQHAIWLTAFAFLLATLFCFFFEEPKIDSEKFTLPAYIHKTKCGIKEIFKNSYIKKISLFYILIGSITWICVISLNMVLLTEMKFTTSQIGIAVATSRTLNSVIFFRLLKFNNVITKKRAFLALPIILVLTYIPGIFLNSWWILIPIMGSMFVSTARWNFLGRYTNAEFDSRYRATAISTLCMIIGVIYVLVVGSSGYLMEHFGGARIIYTALGIVALVTTVPLGVHLAKNHATE